MREDIKDRWVAALKSGKYPKTKYVLKNDDGFCCLGVLCEVVKAELNIIVDVNDNRYYYDGSFMALPESVQSYVGMSTSYGEFVENSLTVLNDNSDTFKPVIEAIEKRWKEL